MSDARNARAVTLGPARPLRSPAFMAQCSRPGRTGIWRSQCNGPGHRVAAGDVRCRDGLFTTKRVANRRPSRAWDGRRVHQTPCFSQTRPMSLHPGRRDDRLLERSGRSGPGLGYGVVATERFSPENRSIGMKYMSLTKAVPLAPRPWMRPYAVLVPNTGPPLSPAIDRGRLLALRTRM